MLGAVRRLCWVVPLDEETHNLGITLAERYSLSIYDAIIPAAARLAGCTSILTEDLHGARIGGMRIRNPFR